MTRGAISKLVNTHGSAWGRVQPSGEEREVFFNPDSLTNPAAFTSIEIGQIADFDERRDQVNGTRATHMVLAGPASVATGDHQ